MTDRLNILSLETETVLVRYAPEFSIKSSHEINLNRILLLVLKENTVTVSTKNPLVKLLQTFVCIVAGNPVSDDNN